MDMKRRITGLLSLLLAIGMLLGNTSSAYAAEGRTLEFVDDGLYEYLGYDDVAHKDIYSDNKVTEIEAGDEFRTGSGSIVIMNNRVVYAGGYSSGDGFIADESIIKDDDGDGIFQVSCRVIETVKINKAEIEEWGTIRSSLDNSEQLTTLEEMQQGIGMGSNIHLEIVRIAISDSGDSSEEDSDTQEEPKKERKSRKEKHQEPAPPSPELLELIENSETSHSLAASFAAQGADGASTAGTGNQKSMAINHKNIATVWVRDMEMIANNGGGVVLVKYHNDNTVTVYEIDNPGLIRYINERVSDSMFDGYGALAGYAVRVTDTTVEEVMKLYQKGVSIINYPFATLPNA